MTLADPPVRDVSSILCFPQVLVWIHPILLLYSRSPTLRGLTFHLPQRDVERTLQESCSSELVSLPSTALPASNGTVLPLNQIEQEELSDHSGHSSESNLGRGCLQAEGPRKADRAVRDIDRVTHILHIDRRSRCHFRRWLYLLCGWCFKASRFPLLIDVRSLTSRGSVKVCDAPEGMVVFFTSLQSEGFTTTDSSRVRRLHSDRVGEFTAPYFERLLTNHNSIFHTFTSGYDPQALGTSELAVGLVKSLAAKALATAQLDPSYWSYSVRLSDILLSLTVSRASTTSKVFTLGSLVVVQELDHKRIKLPESRSCWSFALLGSHARSSVLHPVSSMLPRFTVLALLLDCLLQSTLMN